MKKLFIISAVMLFAAGGLFAQRTITGKVTDESGEALIGATILIRGTTIGSVTDIEGDYTLQVPSDADALVFSYTGYETVEVPLGASDVVDAQLSQIATQLSEIVVVGYGTQIKSTLTGNIAKLEGEKIENLTVPSVEQAIQGRTAGVFVEAVNGKPGGAIRVRVRGASSITASSQPLYVIDGIPVTTTSQNQSGAPLNPLADLNFNDIESIEILKDASAGAIYGSRAANGVVLITTKTGKAGKTRFEANIQTGFSEPSGRREFLNTEEYINLYERNAVGAGRYEYALYPDDWSSEEEAIQWYTDYIHDRFTRYSGHSDWTKRETSTDWQDLAFQTGHTTQASLSAAGGTDRTRFYASGAWSNQQGILVGNGFERMSGRLNLDQQVSDRFNFGINMSLARTFTDQVAGDNAFSTPLQLIAQTPLTPPRNTTDQTVAGTPPGELYDRPTADYYNGLIELENAQRKVTTFRTLGNAFGRFQIIKGLILNGEFGADIYNLKDNAYWGRRTFNGQSTNGLGTSLYAQIVNINSKLYLNYDFLAGAAHNFSITAGAEFQKSTNDRTSVDGQQFPVDDLKTIASAATISAGSSTLTEFSFLSYFGRVTYNFNRKYLLTLSGRVDGSSRFGKNNRYGFFPAVSAGWVLSEESFLADNSVLSFLKLRGSYGITGNAEIGNFNQLGLFGSASYNGTAGLSSTQVANPDLEWEKTAQYDFGIDFGLFNDRVNGELDYYNKRTSDLLLDVPVPGTSGFRTQTKNVGTIENKGVEIVLNANILTGDFKWTFGLNAAFNQNKVIELAEGQELIDEGINVVKVGEPIGVFHGAEYAGVDPANGDALWYLNTEGSGRETTNDYNQAEFVVIGNPNPDWIGGVTSTFSYAGFSLDVMFQGVFGNQIFNSAGVYMSCQGCWFDNQTRDQLNYWDKPGDMTDVPEPRFWYNNGGQDRQSRYISDGTYVKLRTLTLGYEFPRLLIGKAGLSRLRLYIMGQNLLTFTKYDGWDPEVSSDDFVSNISSGQDFYAAPQPRTLTFGLNIGF